jgi:DNA-binding winged helix-turn-helix (wHTH) protein
MDDADARRMFIDRCYIYMGDFLNQKRIEQLMDQMMAEAKPEIVRQKDFNKPSWAWWGYDAEKSLNDEIKSIRTWLSKRGNAFSKNIADYYKLGTPITLTISQEQADQPAAISFNGHRLSEGTFDGKFIKDHQITLQGDEQVNGWLVKTVTSSGMSEETIAGPQLTLTMPQCNNLSITALTQTTAIRSVESTRLQADDAVYDLQGRKVAESASDNLPRGIYIINGKKVVK